MESMDGQFRKAFKGLNDFLACKLEASTRFLVILKDKNVISPENFCVLDGIENNNYRRVIALLGILERRDDCLYNHFCDALKETGQNDVLKRLSTNVKPTVSMNLAKPLLVNVCIIFTSHINYTRTILFNELNKNWMTH